MIPRSLLRSKPLWISRLMLLILLALALALGVWLGARWSGPHSSHETPPAELRGAAEADGLWTCSMHPQVIQRTPGSCPICGMKLTPLAAGTMESGVLRIDPVVVQNMGLRTAMVRRGELVRTIRATGILGEPEPRHVDVTLKVSGWIEKLYASTDGMHVNAGDPLFELYSPELQVAFDELRAALRNGTEGDEVARGVESALRRRLELLGLEAVEIETLASAKETPRTFTFKSPLTGHVTARMVYAGAAVQAGELVLRLADNSRMWIDLRIFEDDLALVKVGSRVSATVEALPGRVLEGEIAFLHPHLDMSSRTALARVEVDNLDFSLREGMYAIARIESRAPEEVLLVPREAVIATGERELVFVALGAGHFEPRVVETGLSGDGGLVEVLRGLGEGETVVTSGQFLLDAESRVQEAIRKFLAPAAQDPGAPSIPPISGDEGWKESVEALILAYLDLAERLGAPLAGVAPLDASALASAAEDLVEHASSEEQLALARPIQASCVDLAGGSLSDELELFAEASASVIALVERSAPTRAVAERLYLMRCPMAEASWLQRDPTVRNPYFADFMKSCGEIVRVIEIPESR